MEEEESSVASGIIPLIIAIIAIVLGGVGLYLGYASHKRVVTLEAQLSEGSSGVAEMDRHLQQVVTRLNEISTKVDTSASDLDALRTRFRILGSQTQESLAGLTNEMNVNREAIAQLNKHLVEVAASATPRRQNTTVAESAQTTDTSNRVAGQLYTIQAGDTFQRIAREHNVSVQALLDANPDADPRRLRIGMEIVIP
jgi:LysM repeat protein